MGEGGGGRGEVGGGYGITIGFVVTSLVYYWCTNGLSLYGLLDTDLHLFTSFNAN